MGSSLRLLLLLFTVTCAFAARRSRVTRGYDARPHEFKSIVAVVAVPPRGRSFVRWCAGTLINRRTVVTAAHCKSEGKMRVIACLHRWSTQGAQMAEVTRQIRHPQFNRRTLSYDMMILKLDRDIPESATVEFARLPTAQDQFPPASKCCTLAGWGMTRDRGPGADTLRKGPLTAVPEDRSDPSILRARPGGPQQTSACKGDSGGPLYCPANDGGQPFQVGVVSGGDGFFCGSRRGLARFGRLSHALRWIQ